MSPEQIVLFDIPSKTRTCWSLNPWKTRLLLNYKGLDYRTEWLEYPDIEPRLKPHLPPNPNPNDTPYTIPTILLPASNTYIMDSRPIATALEAQHPSPPLHLDSPTLPKLEAALRRVMIAIGPVFLPRVPRFILGDASVPHWHATRTEWVGMELDEYERVHPAAGCWDKAEGAVQEVVEMLREGPFFLGGEVSYADFVWAGFLVFCKNLGEEEVYGEVVRRSGEGGGVHGRLLGALEPWLRRCGE